MRRIICVGNRLRADDSAGPAVHDRLQRRSLPADVEVVDGGLAGLDLLRWVEGCDGVVFVDAVSGFLPDPGAGEVDPVAVAAAAEPCFDHAAGLPYLLRMLPRVLDGSVPQVRVVGIEGDADDAVVDRAADLAERIATDVAAAPAPAGGVT